MDTATFKRGLDILERNAKAQAQLVDDILDVSRIISGKLRLELHAMGAVAVVPGLTTCGGTYAGVRCWVLVTGQAPEPVAGMGGFLSA